MNLDDFRLAPMPEAERFWQALAQGRIELPWCDACGAAVYYPRSFCPRCHADVTEWRELSGRGSVYAFGVEHRAIPGCNLEPPFVVALVDLDESCRVVTNILDDPADITVGAPVEAVFDRDASGQTVLRCKLAPT